MTTSDFRTVELPADMALLTGLARLDAAAQVHLVDLPYRLSSWAFDTPENTALWFDGDRLLAWAVLQPPFWTLDYALHPQAPPEMFASVLAWVEATAPRLLDRPNGHPAWFVPVFADQGPRLAALLAAGYRDVSHVAASESPWSQVLLARDLDDLPPPATLPAGYQLRPLRGAAEAAAYVDLHQAVFESRNMTIPWRENTLRQPAYCPALDLVIEAPAGQLAGFCIGWFLASGADGRPTAQIEPLGVHAAHRGLGLARALLSEQLRRMAAMGASLALVETDNEPGPALAAYQAAGFHVHRDIWMVRKDYKYRSAKSR